MTPIWLSHHREEELHRTYRVGGLNLCARCLGMYPVMFAGIVLLFSLRAPLTWRYDVPFALGLTAIGVADFAIGQLRPRAFANPWRTFTGALLGVAFARTLYVHLQRPFPPALIAQGVLVTVVLGPAILWGWYARSR
jgi:uncharacterized membrane protein